MFELSAGTRKEKEKREKKKIRKNRCATFERHIRRQAGRSAEIETDSHLVEAVFFCLSL